MNLLKCIKIVFVNILTPVTDSIYKTKRIDYNMDLLKKNYKKKMLKQGPESINHQ
jgi:hypothetical protein